MFNSFRKMAALGPYLFQSFVLLFVNIFSIYLGKHFAREIESDLERVTSYNQQT